MFHTLIRTKMTTSVSSIRPHGSFPSPRDPKPPVCGQDPVSEAQTGSRLPEERTTPTPGLAIHNMLPQFILPFPNIPNPPSPSPPIHASPAFPIHLSAQTKSPIYHPYFPAQPPAQRTKKQEENVEMDIYLREAALQEEASNGIGARNVSPSKRPTSHVPSRLELPCSALPDYSL